MWWDNTDKNFYKRIYYFCCTIIFMSNDLENEFEEDLASEYDEFEDIDNIDDDEAGKA